MSNVSKENEKDLSNLDQNKAPLFEALLAHSKRDPISFHVPGHKNGTIFSSLGRNLYHHILSLDVTELSGLDDLHHSTGIIKEAEALAANYYGSEQCFFLVGGSTVGNLAMVMSTCKEGDIVLVQRNSHKSILNALRLAKVTPVFIQPIFDHDAQLTTVLDESVVINCIEKNPLAKAIIITNPNYYGYTVTLEKIVEVAHKSNMVVIVDEAHGAHFSHPSNIFPKSAITYKADLVVQSAHKTLPAMTMCSYLHVNSKLVDMKKIQYFLQLFQSSSPSYPLMASLDLARHFLANIGKSDLKKAINEIEKFKDYIKTIPQLKVIESKHYTVDPLKVAIQSCCTLSGFQMQRILEEYGIFTELADQNNILLVMPIVETLDLLKVGENIKHILKDYMVGERVKTITSLRIKTVTSLSLSFKEMEEREVEIIPLDSAIGRIISEEIIPYPPGVPILLSGEAIEENHIKHIYEMKSAGAYFQGSDVFNSGITVFKNT